MANKTNNPFEGIQFVSLVEAAIYGGFYKHSNAIAIEFVEGGEVRTIHDPFGILDHPTGEQHLINAIIESVQSLDTNKPTTWGVFVFDKWENAPVLDYVCKAGVEEILENLEGEVTIINKRITTFHPRHGQLFVARVDARTADQHNERRRYNPEHMTVVSHHRCSHGYVYFS